MLNFYICLVFCMFILVRPIFVSQQCEVIYKHSACRGHAGDEGRHDIHNLCILQYCVFIKFFFFSGTRWHVFFWHALARLFLARVGTSFFWHQKLVPIND